MCASAFNTRGSDEGIHADFNTFTSTFRVSRTVPRVSALASGVSWCLVPI